MNCLDIHGVLTSSKYVPGLEDKIIEKSGRNHRAGQTT